MPHKSTAAKIAEAKRRLGTDRYLDALLVVEHPDGRELWRAGGLWDRIAKRYSSARPAVPLRFRLKQSQVEPNPATGLSLADGFARWLDLMRQGVDAGRPIVLMAEGNRGSGKTLFLGSLVALTVMLEWPRGAQFSVNLSDKQKREVIEGIERIIAAPPAWTLAEVKDPRDPYRLFFNGHRLLWRSGKAPAALREGGITFHYGFVNEAQDQPDEVGINAVGAIRNIGSLVGIATNPDPDGGWVADLKEGIESGAEHDGETHRLDAAHNDAINQATQPKIARVLGFIDKDKADADARGMWKRRGAAYPAFSRKARKVDADGRFIEGHIGEPERVEVGRPLWRDVTREETANRLGGVGWDWIGGSDFQHNPGCCAAIGKLWRDERDTLILVIHDFIGAPGDERAFAQALEYRGYAPGDVDFEGRPVTGRSLVIVGDGTGDIQDSTHRRGNPYSFTQMSRFGWSVHPPMRHRSGACTNPLVQDSLKQMDSLFRAGQILLTPSCMEPVADFVNLADGFSKSLLNGSGKFVKRNHTTHGPDGVRYLAWRFMPRNKLDEKFERDSALAASFRSIRLTDR